MRRADIAAFLVDFVDSVINLVTNCSLAIGASFTSVMVSSTVAMSLLFVLDAIVNVKESSP